MSTQRQREVAETLAALFDLTTRTTEAVGPALETHGLTFNTAYVLWVVDPVGSAPTMREVAERMHCAPSNLTFLADQLERRGLITRAPSPDDGRQRVLHLTPEGKRAREAVVAAFIDACPFAGLDDASLTGLRTLARTALARG